MKESELKQKQDVPPALALMGLAVILGALFYLESPANFEGVISTLDRYADAHEGFLSLILVSISLNLAGFYAVLAPLFGLNKQGTRLRLVAGMQKKGGPKSIWSYLGATGIGLLTFVFLILCEIPAYTDLPLAILPPKIAGSILTGLRVSFALTLALVSLMFARLTGLKNLSWKLMRRMPPFPKPANGIVLGSLWDNKPDVRPGYAVMNQRAINGNIIITASIGSGKTQGSILNICDQILGNFNPRPSMLILDPKGTFIPEAIRITERHGYSDHIVHMKLGGRVTFNPIFMSNPLKEAQFSSMAEMLKAASINFMGKSFDSPFWESSANNLMRNTLVLCATKHFGSVFTLNDLYYEMIQASKDAEETSEYLKSVAAESKFDLEQRHNITKSAHYFVELAQLDEKVRTGILATATAFLNQFEEYQASQIFCPKADEMSIRSMDEIVDQGKILLFDIAAPGLSRSMGTFIKLHYQQSVLNRLKNPNRSRERMAVILADEYQNVVSSGGGIALGDDRFCSMSREANAAAIVATQSLTSIKNSVGKDDAVKELIQNFRTMIAGNSTDLMTIRYFQELMGQEDRTRVSHSVSENAHRPSRNLILGGFEAKDANISESFSTSEEKEYAVTGKEFATLSSFETFARIFDGFETHFHKLFLKPYFLEDKRVLHSKLIQMLKSTSGMILMGLALFGSSVSHAFPNVCTVVKSKEFRSCLDFSIGTCMCGWPVPRPCAHFSYYIPQTFIEVFPDPKSSYFGDLPGAAVQLGTLSSSLPYGAESDDDTQSFQAHALAVPLTMIPFSTLPCHEAVPLERFCFDAMSEHLGSKWKDGSGDTLQPNWLAWSLSPKACLIKGAATSLTGGSEASYMPTVPGCSMPMDWMPKFAPSNHSACTGWGAFYPRAGTYNGPSQTTGALMIASRLKSLGTEVFHTTPSSMDESWQMIAPQTSSCFKEGQNVAILDTVKDVREINRLATGKMKGYLFTVWNKVSCCRDLAEIPTAYVALEAMSLACQGLGGGTP